MEESLNIGDIVCLYAAECSGFLFSFQSSSVHNQLAVGTRQDHTSPDIQVQHAISFEICVANRYKLNKDYRKLSSKSLKDKKNVKLREEVLQAQKVANSENEDNELEQKRQQGKRVMYGEIIQLKHIFTGKFIHVSTTKTSDTESSNMAVELLEHNGKHAQFKIMPRYKVKAEGDVVQVDDQIVLESVKSPSSYLHVSNSFLGSASVYSKKHELNLSVVQTGFTVYRKYKPMPDDGNKVKVADVIRFYHKEMEANLVAEGLVDEELIEDVHLRMRPLDRSNPKTLSPSSSAVTYWQIELQDGPVSGGVLKWEQKCKIIHMCSRKYLTINGKDHVTLTRSHNDPATVFRLHPVIRETDDILKESYCRIEHVDSGYWLHALPEEYKEKQTVDTEDTNSMSSLKWSNAELRKIGAIPKKQYDDAFTIQVVEQELVDIFNYMAGMVPFIQKIVKDKQNGVVLNAKMTHDAITALSEMEAFMVVNSSPIKKRQKLMRNLRMVELLISLLQVPFRGSPDQHYLVGIFRKAYDVLYAYLAGDSRKNELFIAKYIDFFLSQFEIKEERIGQHAVHMALELIGDNRKIVDRISHEHIDKFVDILNRDKNYVYLELLGVLCLCDGVAITDNQRYITEVWLRKRKQNCVFLTDLGQKIGKQPKVVFVSTNMGETWQELAEFAKAELNNDSYHFLKMQLQLFGSLCFGQNDSSISVITKELNYLTWEEAFTCLRDERLPEELRAQYCDLIITMFVDIRENHSVVDRVKLSYLYADIDNHEETIDLKSSPTSQYFQAISTWIAKFLKMNKDMRASEISKNRLIKQVLHLVHHLVSLGFYYKTTDIKDLLQPLMRLLDGRNDKPYLDSSGKEHDQVLKHFQNEGRYQKGTETEAIVDAKCQALDVLDLFFNFIFNLRLKKFMNLFKVTLTQANKTGADVPELQPLLDETFDPTEHQGASKTALKKLKDIFDETEFLKDHDLLNVLKDLSSYQYDEIVRMSMHLLNRYYSAHNNLFSIADQAQVCITEESIDISKRLASQLPVLRRYYTAKLTESQTEDLCSILQHLTNMCHLDGEPEEHGMNQLILYNHGVLEDCFNILTEEIDVKLLDQYSGQRKIFQKTFSLLKLMARNNKLVQGRLFDRLDMLLSVKGAEPELAEALTEVFTGNSETCLKINGSQVQKVMSIVSKNKESVPEFLDMLNAVVKVEELDLPLKRNQGFVLQYFMQYRTDVAFIIDQDESSREKVLMDTAHKDLQYLISMVDMLATCAEGGNRFVESICQTIFKIPELLRILTNSRIIDNHKRPFLRFFIWVYLNTAGGMIESGPGDLPHNKMMWDYLKSLNGTLKTVTKDVTNDPELVQSLLKRPPTKCDERSVSKQEILRGSLHYLFDGVMPFLLIFCRSYYQPDLFRRECKIINDIARHFKDFMEVVAELISNEKQMKNLVSCMTTVLSASTLPSSDMEEFLNIYSDKIEQDVRSDARKDYENYFKKEEEINKQLHVFAKNMKKAYGGDNTVRAQIGYHSDEDYSELGGDEELPLGQEFQDHLKFFINKNPKESSEKYQMTEKLIKQLMISSTLTDLNEKGKLEQVDLDIKCLQLLRGLIHNEIVKLPQEWELHSSMHRKQLKVIEDVQNALGKYNILTGVLSHLSRPQDSVVREVLSFLAALLFNGNEKVQSSFITYFTGTRDETFFFTIKERMSMSALATRERRLLDAMYQAKIAEADQQEKALKKVMTAGKITTMERTKNSQLESMLSEDKVVMKNVQLRSRQGTRLRGSRYISHRISSMPQQEALSSNLMTVLQSTGLSGKNKMGSLSKPSNVATIEVENVEEKGSNEFKPHVSNMKVELSFRDEGDIELVLRILGLMCDNQRHALQNYLREQPDNIKSVNLVAETTRFLNILYSNLNEKTMPLIIQLFDTLVEFTSGNQQNVAVLFDNKICDYINHILRVGFYRSCTLKEKYELKKSIVTLIKALTEENPPDATVMADSPLITLTREGNISASNKLNLPTTQMEVMEYLDTNTLVKSMTEAYDQIQKPEQESEDLQTLVYNTGFAYFHILCRKIDLDKKSSKTTIVKTEKQEEAWDYFDENTRSIEILKDDVLQKIYFRVKDKEVLREEIKEKFKYEVDRSSAKNKLRNFMDWTSDIIQDIKYQRKVSANPLGKQLVRLWKPMNYVVLMLSFLICLVMMITWRGPELPDGSADVNSSKPNFSFSNYPYFLYICGSIHNILCLCVYVTFIISNNPTFPPWHSFKRLVKKTNDDDMELRSRHEKKTKKSHLEVKIYSFKSMYYLMFFIFSVLGTVFWGYFFAFHLLHIMELNQLLKRVIQAVTTNGQSLIMVALLGLAVLYIYALVAFAVLRERYFLFEKGRHCRTLYECCITMIHHSLLETPYTTFQDMMTSDFNDALMLAVFDVTFFILITIIGVNIVFGIIVDTFAQLRDSKWEIDKDMRNRCFICSRESYEFERQGGGFEKHVHWEHNQWAYLFFFIYLDETRPNDYSALELHVYRLLQNSQTTFFPTNRAMSLQKKENAKEKTLKSLSWSVEYIVSKMKEDGAAKERKKEKQRQIAWEQKYRLDTL